MAPIIFSGHTIEYTLISFYEGIDIKFRVDALGLLFATISSFSVDCHHILLDRVYAFRKGTCADKV